MSSAHIFYLPIMIMIGFFAGYFFGVRSAEAEAAEKARLANRKNARRQQREAADSADA